MSVKVLNGDCRQILTTLPDRSVDCCVTSPPYFGLRDYGHADQIGLEKTPDAFVAQMVVLFRDVRRVLKDDGTLWLNLGDSYAGAGYSNNKNTGGAAREEGGKQKHMTATGLKNKDLVGIPWRVAFALQADGWWLRQDIIWAKPNPMPESVKDRCTKAHEYIFMLTKGPQYFYDADAISEDARLSNGKVIEPKKQDGHGRRHEGFNGRWDRDEDAGAKRNKRSVWTVATRPFAEAHFATFPPDLIVPCILAGCPKDGTVLDPFGGAGTTGLVADRNGRNAILIELNPEYAAMAIERINSDAPLFGEVA